MPTPQTFLPHGGSYKNLIAYQKAECIYDVTFYFTHHFLEKNDRTIDQMVQAARSGKQNIAEGAAAGNTSKETEIKLTNVAKASLQELLADYEDYLRVRDLQQWGLGDARFSQAQRACSQHNDSAFYRNAMPFPIAGDNSQHRHHPHPPDRLAPLTTHRKTRKEVCGKRRNEGTDDKSKKRI